MFKSIVAEKDYKSSEAIVDYLDKHFKQKALLKKQQKMMGNTEEELKEKIAEMEMNQANTKFVNVEEFAKRKQKHKEETYI
jgi:hypothetical protein